MIENHCFNWFENLQCVSCHTIILESFITSSPKTFRLHVWMKWGMLEYDGKLCSLYLSSAGSLLTGSVSDDFHKQLCLMPNFYPQQTFAPFKNRAMFVLQCALTLPVPLLFCWHYSLFICLCLQLLFVQDTIFQLHMSFTCTALAEAALMLQKCWKRLLKTHWLWLMRRTWRP